MAASDEKNLMEATAKHVKSIKRDRVAFAGAAFLEDGKLLVGDSTGSKVLLFEPADDFFYLQEIKLESSPKDLVVKGKNIFILTSDNKIRKCEMLEDEDEEEFSLTTLETFAAPKNTSNMDACSDGLLVNCAEGFQVVGEDGTFGKLFKVKGNGHVTVSPDLKRFYHRFHDEEVSGRKLNDGNEVFNFSIKTLQNPYDFAVDRQGNVYACGFGSRNVVQISKNGRKHRVLIDKFDNVTNPAGLLLHPRKEQLVIFGQSREFEVWDF